LGAVNYELRVLERIRKRWTVPQAVVQPRQIGSHVWCAFTYVPGRPRRLRTPEAIRTDERSRGRLLAELHADLEELSDLGQRPGWVRREEVLGPRSDGATLEQLLKVADWITADQLKAIHSYIDRTREWLERSGATRMPVSVIHGDLHGGNVLYSAGKLSGIIDFDMTHLDHRVADFAWTWRGYHDEVVHGYQEVMPLSSGERELIAPVFWSWVLDGIRHRLLWRGASARTSLAREIRRLTTRSSLTKHIR
jgi:Ser/Thr protein kinase RdoA (MazF antagonist)